MELAAAQILIELDVGASPIAGSVRAGPQPPVSFAGWTGLFAVLRAAAGDDGRAADRGANNEDSRGD
jgi:hypothetical protein